jgi:hypothetical protein
MRFLVFVAFCVFMASLAKAETRPNSNQSGVPAPAVTASPTDEDYSALQEIFDEIQDDLKVMSAESTEVVSTTVDIGRMMMKMRMIESRNGQKKISDDNLAVDPKKDNLEELKIKFEDVKDEHWSRFAIPNFEYRFFKRDRDLVTVTNPVSLQKILTGIAQARGQFMPTGCFSRDNKAFIAAPICNRRLALCGQSGYASKQNKLVAYRLDANLEMEPVALEYPEEAEDILGTRYDSTSERATLLSDEVFYFCKLAAKFGAQFKAEPYFYPSEVARK